MLISSVAFFMMYLGFMLYNLRVVLDSAKNHNWLNFEGLAFYSLLIIQSATLNQYCKSKFADFENSITRFRDKLRKSN